MSGALRQIALSRTSHTAAVAISSAGAYTARRILLSHPISLTTTLTHPG